MACSFVIKIYRGKKKSLQEMYEEKKIANYMAESKTVPSDSSKSFKGEKKKLYGDCKS